MAILATEFVVEIVGKGHLIIRCFFERFSNAEVSFGVFFKHLHRNLLRAVCRGLHFLCF